MFVFIQDGWQCHSSYFTADLARLPDSDTAAMLLGTALSSFAMVRRISEKIVNQ